MRNKREKNRKVVADAVDQVMNNPALTDKQRLFCVLYVRCFNATKAYQKAYGCDYNTAASIGYRLLENVGVRDEISRLKQNRLNREMLDEHDVFQKYMDIAFADITDFVEFGREEIQVMSAFGPIMQENPDTGEKVPLMKEVNVVRFKDSSQLDGTLITEVRQGKDGASIKLADRMKALDWLAAHMDLATEEQKVKIAAIKSKLGENDEEETQEDGFLDALTGVASEDWKDMELVEAEHEETTNI